MLTPGTALSPDVAYWRHIMLFAAGLTAQQQFLPNVTQHGNHTKAVWTPLYVGDDAHWRRHVRLDRVTDACKPPTSLVALTVNTWE